MVPVVIGHRHRITKQGGTSLEHHLVYTEGDTKNITCICYVGIHQANRIGIPVIR